MPYKDEMMVMGGDAPADITTQLCFNPPEGPFPPGNTNIVTGTISDNSDEDWIAIKLTAGVLYTFNLSGVDHDAADATEGAAKDTILKLYDAKGGFIKQNDDADGPKGKLDSTFQFVPEESGTYFLSASVFAANLGADNSGGYQVTVTQQAAGIPDPIEGGDEADKLRGTDAGEKISGMGGNDSLFGLGGNDVLSGGAGDDLLVGGMGGDTLNGGEGEDTISYNTSLEGVTINLTDGSARGGDADGDTIGDDIENVVGSGHDDVLTGNRGPNKLHGLAGNDTLDGDEGNDELNGGAGDDVLDGGDEDDTLVGGPGADTLTGGQGDDTVSYAGSMMGVEVRLHANRADGGDAKGDVFADTTTNTYTIDTDPDPEETVEEQVTETVPDFIHLTGSVMADVLAGDSRGNTIKGGGGDDMIYGGPGGSHDDSDNDDMLHGEGGNDKIYGGKGRDTLDGGPGNDLLVGGSGEDTYMAGAGSDMIYADRADIGGTAGTGGSIAGGDEADGKPGMDTLSFAKFMDDDLDGGTGITLNLQTNTGVTGIEHLIGTAEDDTLTGRDGTSAEPAAETIEGGDGGDTLVGGAGPGDTVSYASSDRGVRVDLGDGTTGTADSSRASRGHAGGDTISGFENVMGSAFDDDLTARATDVDTTADGAQGSILWGGDGDDTLEGAAADDTLEGGAGADELDGGFTASTDAATLGQNTQVNTLSYAMSDAGVRVNLAAASASGGHADGDEIEIYELTQGTGDDEREFDVATFRNLTGSMHNDHLTGDMFANQLAGGGGDDSLRGAAGADVLVGGPGADSLDGGEDSGERNNMVPDPADTDPSNGIDMIAASEDWAAYRDAMAGVTLDLDLGAGTAGEAMGDTLRNIELIWGSQHGDTFIASAGHDVIHGDGGSDTVSYEASRHGVTVVLPTTDDTYQYTAADSTATPPTMEMFDAAPATGDDSVAEWRAGGTANERPAAVQAEDYRSTTKSYAEGDILESIENVTGSRDKDVITGDGVPNVLKGGGGHDELAGQAGNDKLYGGEGNDLLGRTTGTPLRAAEDLNGDGDELDPGEAEVPAVDAITDDAGDDMLDGGPGNDKLYGGAGADTLNGGPGDDDLQGDAVAGTNTAADVFVFTRDGLGSDVILDFSNTGGVATTDGTATTDGLGDKIDLRAFDIDAGDLPGLLSERAGSVIVNLEGYGGGRITIQGVTKAGLMADTDGDHLVHDDQNGMEAGVGTDGTDGVFIL